MPAISLALRKWSSTCARTDEPFVTSFAAISDAGMTTFCAIRNRLLKSEPLAKPQASRFKLQGNFNTQILSWLRVTLDGVVSRFEPQGAYSPSGKPVLSIWSLELEVSLKFEV